MERQDRPCGKALCSWGSSIALLPGLLVNGALAQQLEEVLVTAQKRSENIQDVPVSIQAFSGDELSALGVRRLRDVVQFTPGLTMNASSVAETDTVFTVRGIGMNSVNSNQNPAVMMYLDEVPLPTHILLGMSLFDIDRMEVLKGPQGTLYGRNTTGGAIRVMPRRPTREFSATGRVEFTRFDGIETEAAVGGPLTETLSARFAANIQRQQRGWQTLVVPDKNLFGPGVDENNGEIDRAAYRLSLLWEPSESFDALFTIDYGRDESESMAFKHTGNQRVDDPSQLCSFNFTGIRNEEECASFGQVRDAVGGDPVGSTIVLQDRNPDERVVLANFGLGNRIDSESGGAALTLNADLARMQFTSVTGYRELSRTVPNDQGGAPFNTNEVLQFDDVESFTQEFRLASDESWGDLKWIVGLFYSNDDIANTTIADFRDALPFSGRFTTSFDQNTEGVSAFGQVEYQLANQWRVSAGLRYTDEDRNLDFFGNLEGTGPVPIEEFRPDSINTSEFGGRLSLDYTPSENVLVYASVNRGFKSGGFPAAIAFSIPQLQPFEEEILTAYEIGFKSSFAQDRGRLNVVGYYYDWEDFQAATAVDRVDPVSGQEVRVVVLTNAGDAEIKGIEAELAYQLSDTVRFQVGANFMDRDIVSGNFEGDTPAHAPQWNVSGQLGYTATQTFKGLRPFGTVNVSYISEQEFILANSPGAVVDEYTLVDLNLGLVTEDERWTFSGFVRNLTDKTYVSEVFGPGSTFLPTRTLFGPPRIYGASIEYTF